MKAFHISYEDTSGQHHVESYEAETIELAKALLKHPIKRYLGIITSDKLFSKKNQHTTKSNSLNNNSIFSQFKDLSKDKRNYGSIRVKDLLN